jgi:protein-tyrosine phosphatase
MKKILMVCLGNICRSPMAEGIIREEFRKKGIEIQVDSAGTAAYHVGEGADSRAQVELAKHNIDISHERAQKFVPKFFDEYDMIFAMDQQNYADILAQVRTEEDRNKVDMLMNLVEKGKNISIPDPYYGGDEGFTRVYEMIKMAGEKLVEKER